MGMFKVKRVKTRFGAQYMPESDSVIFRIYSKNATRLEICFFDQPRGADEIKRMAMTLEPRDTWILKIPLSTIQNQGFTTAVYYGLRAWGPNWKYEKNWQKGTEIGFVCDVDEQGNRFNPNKLLIDPYAREISHDPQPRLSPIDPNEYHDDYYSGCSSRHIDTAKTAPKSILFPENDFTPFMASKPERSIKDDIIYEVSLRGFTRLDEAVPEKFRGTYKGAGMKAGYLKKLGISAVEFLPVHHFADEQNDDDDPLGDNYWGYMTLGYFAPNRRYSSDKTPGGPTSEFREMIDRFHTAGIKVFIDVVYNHTGEGLLKRATDDGDSREDDEKQFVDRACILSFRGLDNASFYTLRSRQDLDGGKTNHRYQDNSACGGSLNVSNEMVRDFIIDSLKYWADDMGVDGFRFDLAPVLANSRYEGGFEFNASDPKNVLNRMVLELPLRNSVTLKGVDLIAEPWATGSGDIYQLGNFPDGWSEWNDTFRDTFRQAENKLHVVPVNPSRIANAFSGSAQQFRWTTSRMDPRPYNSINYIVSHDGYCLRDLFSVTGSDNAWDHAGNPFLQRQAVRNAFAVLMVSAGVPMFTGGDELYRSQGGRKNIVAVDHPSVYLNWDHLNIYLRASADNDDEELKDLRTRDDIGIYEFSRKMIHFRNKHPCLRPLEYFTGLDVNGSGLKDIAWYRMDGFEFRPGDWNNPFIHFVAFRVDNTPFEQKTLVRSVYVAYNFSDQQAHIVLPENMPGKRWFRIADTGAWMEEQGNFEDGKTMLDRYYSLHERSVLILAEK